MSGKHSRSTGDRCTCPNTQLTHTCSRLNGKQNHNYDETEMQTQTTPMQRVSGKSVDIPPPIVGD